MRRIVSLSIALAAASCGGGGTDSSSNPSVPTTTCLYELSPSSQSVIADGGSLMATLTRRAGSCAWSASQDVNWITQLTASGANSGTLNYSVAANTTTAARVGRLSVNWTDGSASLIVTQEGRPAIPCSYLVTPTSVSVPNGGASGQLAVTVSGNSNCSWMAAANQPWISLSSGSSGTSTGAIGYTIAANTGAERLGRITVNTSTNPIDVDFTQAAAPPACTLSLDPTSVQVGPQFPAGRMTLTTSVRTLCAWTASSDSPWLTIQSGFESGSGRVTDIVALFVFNNTGATRIGRITVTTGPLTAQYTVTQLGVGGQ